ncbi:hypothetical protein DXG01_003789 [Tephrocybe rancida]|nr:hypothetical protein DXG01_003789 [Tephrocybe rancida]
MDSPPGAEHEQGMVIRSWPCRSIWADGDLAAVDIPETAPVEAVVLAEYISPSPPSALIPTIICAYPDRMVLSRHLPPLIFAILLVCEAHKGCGYREATPRHA